MIASFKFFGLIAHTVKFYPFFYDASKVKITSAIIVFLAMSRFCQTAMPSKEVTVRLQSKSLSHY